MKLKKLIKDIFYYINTTCCEMEDIERISLANKLAGQLTYSDDDDSDINSNRLSIVMMMIIGNKKDLEYDKAFKLIDEVEKKYQLWYNENGYHIRKR